jgi:hypothetical protein
MMISSKRGYRVKPQNAFIKAIMKVRQIRKRKVRWVAGLTAENAEIAKEAS